jgi:holo-[acyl-carrier protein] synthase
VIVGLGIDLVETERIARALERHGARFCAKVFSPDELHDCEARTDRVLALAARFAVKEACLKALGTGWSAGLAFCQIETVRGADGRPALRLSGAALARAEALGVRASHVSLTHERGAAAAVVILEG